MLVFDCGLQCPHFSPERGGGIWTFGQMAGDTVDHAIECDLFLIYLVERFDPPDKTPVLHRTAVPQEALEIAPEVLHQYRLGCIIEIMTGRDAGRGNFRRTLSIFGSDH